VCRCRDRCLLLLASSGRYTHIDGQVHRRVPFGCYKIGRVAADQDSKFLTTTSLTIHACTIRTGRRNRGWCLLPATGFVLRWQSDRRIGPLSKHAISPDEDALLESVARITAQVAQTCQAEENLERARERTEQLNEQLEDNARQIKSANQQLLLEISERKVAEEKQAELLQKLSEINQELKDFAYVVSHDLKAPLRAIKTLADWLLTDYQDKLDTQGKENLQLLGSRVDRMHNLIDGVLQYSRVGRTEQGTKPVDLGQLLPEIVTDLGVRSTSRFRSRAICPPSRRTPRGSRRSSRIS